MSAIKKRLLKTIDKILKKQALECKLNDKVCNGCNLITKNTKLVLTGKSANDLCEDVCSKFDIYSVNSLTPEIKKHMEQYLEEQQRKYCKPMYLCYSCQNKSVK